MTTSVIFVGSQTRWKEKAGKGIYSGHVDTKNGALTVAHIFSEIENPSFLIVSQNADNLYCVIEIDDYAGNKSGAVAAFSVDPDTRALTLLNRYATQGAHPCHLSLDKTERALFVSNYGGGSVAVFPVQLDGRLDECSQFIAYEGASIHPNQTVPHAHSAIVSPDNQYVFIQDLGTDTIRRYRLVFHDAKPKLIEQQPAVNLQPGAGPRHLIFSSHQPIAYLMNELNSTVVVFDYLAEKGELKFKQVISSLPAGFSGKNSAADIHMTYSGRFLYASNRGHDSLAIFAVDPETGELTGLGHQSTLGEHPRNFTISPDDHLLLCANRNTDNIVSFYLDATTGALTPTGQNSYDFYKPVCVVVM